MSGWAPKCSCIKLYYLLGWFKWAPVYLSALYSPIIAYNICMAKNSGSFQVGALKKTPKFTLTISSSLINKVEGVKKGLSRFF